MSRYQQGKTNPGFTEARDSEWQWHQLGRMQVCTVLQTDSHASTPPLSFLQAGCPSCCPANSFKALKATVRHRLQWFIHVQADSLRKEDALLMVCDTFLCVVVTVMSLAV